MNAPPALPRGGIGTPSPQQFFLLAIVWITWGTAYPAMGFTMQVLDPLTMRVVVMLLAGLSLLVYARLVGTSLWVPPALWRDLGICAFLNMTVCQVGMTFGVYYVGAGRSSVLIYTMPIWAALFARLLLGETITRRRALALLLGGASVVAMLAQSLPQVRNAPLGVLVTVLAAAGFGLGTVWTKRAAWTGDLNVLTGWQLIIGALPLLPIWLLIHPPVDLARLDAGHWATIAYMVLVANAIAYTSWFRLVRRLPAAVVGVGSLVVPCVGILSSALLVDEAVQPNDMVALALVCSALVLVLFEPRRAAVR